MDPEQASPLDLRIAIVAADPLARAGLVRVLEAEAGLQIVAETPLTADPVRTIESHRPELVLVDLGWESEGDLEALAEWAEAGAPLLLLLPDDRPPGPLWGLGVGGLLGRERPATDLAAAASAVAQGLLVLDPDFARPALGESAASAPLQALTERELEVLQLLAEGRSNRSIGQQLSISEHTVKFHVTSILGKLGAESRTEAAVVAARAGLIIL